MNLPQTSTPSTLVLKVLPSSLVQELLVGHFDVAHVPEDPEDQTQEDHDGSGEHEEVPELQRREDAQQKQGESGGIQQQGQEKEAEATTHVLGVAHHSDLRPNA